jgi:branched-chain amino acid transport system permease protein
MLQAVIDGLLQGGVLALAAAGFSLVFGVMHVLNLTHGIFVLTGGYLALLIWHVTGIDPLLCIPAVGGVLFIVGYVYQRCLLQLAIQRASLMSTLIVTMGIALASRNLLTLVFSPDVQTIRPWYATVHWTYRGLVVDVPHLLAFVASLSLLGILAAILERTSLGRMIRATAQQPLAARLCAIDVEHVFGLTFGLAAGFAGAAGVIVGMLFPFTPASEGQWTLYAFIVVVLGGVGSPGGALLGGLLLGLVGSLTVQLIGPAFPNAMAFLMLVLMLLVRPNGILGNAFGASR